MKLIQTLRIRRWFLSPRANKVNKKMQKPNVQKLRQRQALISTESDGKKFEITELIASTLPTQHVHTRDAIHATFNPWAATYRLGIIAASLLVLAIPHAWGSSGTVAAWGAYFDNQPNTPPAGLSGVTALAANLENTFALKSDGTVVAWGPDYYGQTIVASGLSNVTAIAAHHFYFLALKSDGTVVGVGANAAPQLITIPEGLSNVTAIAAGDVHSLALKSDGTVVSWGFPMYSDPSQYTGLRNVTAIAAGSSHSLALKSDGTVSAWGFNTYGNLSLPAGLTNVIAIAAGDYHSLALKSDGTVVAWGYNFSGQATVPAGLSNVTAIAAGWNHSLALKRDGTVVAWGDWNWGQTNVPAGLSSVTGIAAGAMQSLAIVSVPPQQAIANLEGNIHALVDAGILKPRQASGLTQPLDNAMRSLAKGKPADACNQLLDFVTNVFSKTPNPLDPATAADLVAAAEDVCSSIGCK